MSEVAAEMFLACGWSRRTTVEYNRAFQASTGNPLGQKPLAVRLGAENVFTLIMLTCSADDA